MDYQFWKSSNLTTQLTIYLPAKTKTRVFCCLKLYQIRLEVRYSVSLLSLFCFISDIYVRLFFITIQFNVSSNSVCPLTLYELLVQTSVHYLVLFYCYVSPSYYLSAQ